MANLIQQATILMASGNKRKEIAEYVGRLNSGTDILSIAHMKSPAGWAETGQTPDFDEYTVILRGTVRAETRDGTFEIKQGQAMLARRGEWVRYSTPDPEGAEYVAICTPAFSPELVHRDE